MQSSRLAPDSFMTNVVLLNGTHFTCKPSVSILDNALANGVSLEHSCKTGQCGVCASRVLAGHTEVLKSEISLNTQQREQGFVLTCCRAATTDLQLDTEDLPELQGLTVKTCPARIDSLEHLNSSVIRVVLRTPPNNGMQFLPGQYISLIGPNSLRRSYSVANAPRDDNKIELHIKQVKGGAFSQYWFEQAKVNDLLRFEGPLGTFFVRSPLPKKLIFMATGTGLAPVKAMLEHLEQYAEANRPEIHVYWGNRHEADVYTNLHDLAGPNVHAHLLLSRPGPSWAGRTGYVQQAALEDHSKLDNCAVYACGSISMIESAKSALKENGLPSNKFHSDAFVSSNQ